MSDSEPMELTPQEVCRYFWDKYQYYQGISDSKNANEWKKAYNAVSAQIGEKNEKRQYVVCSAKDLTLVKKSALEEGNFTIKGKSIEDPFVKGQLNALRPTCTVDEILVYLMELVEWFTYNGKGKEANDCKAQADALCKKAHDGKDIDNYMEDLSDPPDLSPDKKGKIAAGEIRLDTDIEAIDKTNTINDVKALSDIAKKEKEKETANYIILSQENPYIVHLYQCVRSRAVGDDKMGTLKTALEEAYPGIDNAPPLPAAIVNADVYQAMERVVPTLADGNKIKTAIWGTSIWQEHGKRKESWKDLSQKDPEMQQFWADVKALQNRRGIDGIDDIATQLSKNKGYDIVSATDLKTTNIEVVKKRVYQYLKKVENDGTQLAPGDEDKFDVKNNAFYQRIKADQIHLKENVALLKAYYKEKGGNINDDPFMRALNEQFSCLTEEINNTSAAGSVSAEGKKALGAFLKSVNPDEYQKSLLRQEIEAKDCQLDKYLQLLDGYNKKYSNSQNNNGMDKIKEKFPDLLKDRQSNPPKKEITLAEEQELLQWLKRQTPDNAVIQVLEDDISLEQCQFEKYLRQLKQFYKEKYANSSLSTGQRLSFKDDPYLLEIKKTHPQLDKLVRKVEYDTTVSPPQPPIWDDYLKISQLRSFFLTQLPKGRDTYDSTDDKRVGILTSPLAQRFLELQPSIQSQGRVH